MKQLTPFCIIAFFAIIFFTSCEFEPDGENFTEVEPPDSTTMIQVSLSPFETQYVFTVPTEVNYNLNTFGLSVYNVEFFVGDQSIHTGSEATGFFVFKPSPWGIGVQTMTMVITTNTNTGSLADKLGAEGLIFQQSWEVLLDGGNPNQLEITGITNQDGILNIEWEEYERFNFQKYVLYKNFGTVEWEGNAHIIVEITDPTQHSWNDSSFIGGTGIYWVEVYASNQKAVSAKKQYDAQYPKLELLWTKSDSAGFRWDKNLFYKALDRTVITSPDYYPNPDKILFSTNDNNIASCVVTNLRFGKPAEYTLSFYPKLDIEVYQDEEVLRSKVSFGIGKQINKFTKIVSDPKGPVFYLSNNENTIYKYNFPQITVNDSCESGFFPDWFVSSYDHSLATLYNSNITIYRKGELNNREVYSPYDFGLSSFWNSSSISEINTMEGAYGFGIGVSDLDKKEIIASKVDYNHTFSSLSPDGKYIIAKKSLGYYDQVEFSIWQVNETGMEQVGKLPSDVYSLVKWMPGGGHQLIVLKGYEFEYLGKTESKFAVYDAATVTQISEFQLKVGHFTGIDPLTKTVAFWSTVPGSDRMQNLYLYNYETGGLLKQIPLSESIFEIAFFKNYIFSGEGFYMNISEF